MKFVKKHSWEFALSICFISGVIACFGTTGIWFWFAILGSMGTGIAALYCFLHPANSKPFEKIYQHEEWQFDPNHEKFPILTISAKEHGMGIKPRLEFRQSDWVFPWQCDDNGNITIIRNNNSIGRFDDLGVIIRANLY